MEIKDTINNFEFVSLFGLQNLKVRTSFLTFVPPKIYTVQSSRGGVYMPAACVSSYDVKSIGATRDLTLKGSKYLIPEAYKVSITLKELIQESGNIMSANLDGSKVNVMGDYTGNDIVNAAGTIGTFFDAVNNNFLNTKK